MKRISHEHELVGLIGRHQQAWAARHKKRHQVVGGREVRTRMADVIALRQAQIERDHEAAAEHERRLRRDSERATAAFKRPVVCSYWYCRREGWVSKDAAKVRCKHCGTVMELQ